MGKYSDYILVTDMDGTLLNRARVVTEENLAALHRFVEGGGNFAIATGRTPKNTQMYLTNVPINTSCIFFNGAMLYDYNKHLVTKDIPLEGEASREFIRYAVEHFPDVCTMVFTQKMCYVASPTSPTAPMWKKATFEYVFSNVEETLALEDDWLKIMLYGNTERIRQLVAAVDFLHMDEIANHFFTADTSDEETSYEYVSKSASKGHVLKYLRELPENVGRKVIAMGDCENDNFMLQMADVGVAPENAEESTKKSADIIGVHCNEHLAAHVIGLIDAGEI